jgi:uncharacterized membrane protein YeaQ/YmgE (transglycosylase-associated protein family)
MDASAMNKAEPSVAHLMLHRNINLGSIGRRQRGPACGAQDVRRRVGASADSLVEFRYAARAASYHRGGMLGPGRQGEDIVIGVDSIIIMLIVGAIAGWLAGQIVRGFGFGLLWNIVIGIIGAFVGVWLLKQLGFMPFAGFVGSIVNATIGAVILLIIVGFIRR